MAWKASPAAASFEDSDEHPSAMPGTGLGLVGRSPEPWPGLQVSLHRRRSAVMRIVLRCWYVCTGSLLFLSARLWRDYDDAWEAPPRSFQGTSAGGLDWSPCNRHSSNTLIGGSICPASPRVFQLTGGVWPSA